MQVVKFMDMEKVDKDFKVTVFIAFIVIIIMIILVGIMIAEISNKIDKLQNSIENRLQLDEIKYQYK